MTSSGRPAAGYLCGGDDHIMPGDVAGQFVLLRLALFLGQRPGVPPSPLAEPTDVSSMKAAPSDSASVLVSGRTS